MSGHSKWSKIKHQKGAADVSRGQLFTKLTREIMVAVRNGGSNPELNSHLRLALQKARDSRMPWDNIDRAMKKASGSTEAANLSELTIEGYGPAGTAILVKALSDNRNRALQDVRNIFTRHGGSLGNSGSVAWLFDNKGLITVKPGDLDTEDLALKAIDAGAEDVKVEDGFVEIYTKPDELEKVRQTLEINKIPVASAELSMIPKTTIELEEKAALQALRLLNKLEELDDVQHVSSNANFLDEIVEKYHSQT